MTDTGTTPSDMECHETPEPTTLAELESRLRRLDNERVRTEEALARATRLGTVRALEERLRNIATETMLLERRRGPIRRAEVERDIEREAARVRAEAMAGARLVVGPLATIVDIFEQAWQAFDEARAAAIAAGAPPAFARHVPSELPQRRAWNRVTAGIDDLHNTASEIWAPMLAEAAALVGEPSTSTEPGASTGRRRRGRK